MAARFTTTGRTVVVGRGSVTKALKNLNKIMTNTGLNEKVSLHQIYNSHVAVGAHGCSFRNLLFCVWVQYSADVSLASQRGREAS